MVDRRHSSEEHLLQRSDRAMAQHHDLCQRGLRHSSLFEKRSHGRRASEVLCSSVESAGSLTVPQMLTTFKVMYHRNRSFIFVIFLPEIYKYWSPRCFCFHLERTLPSVTENIPKSLMCWKLPCSSFPILSWKS